MSSRCFPVLLLVILGCSCLAAVLAETKTDDTASAVDSASVQVERRSAEEDLDGVDSLVSSGRTLRNSYVRFGRSSPDSLEDSKKRSKHYVRFGRDAGRHYVRFGRSVAESEEDDGLIDDDKRSSNKHYVRFGRADAGRHYVRFGRSSLGDDDEFVDALDDEAMEDSASKRSGGKHYVRFGRTAPATAAADAAAEQLEDAVDKRSKHYVRFGRSDQLERQDTEAVKVADESADKRANYVRFG
jgi:hypothetical protein